jgi:hypothetical protein
MWNEEEEEESYLAAVLDVLSFRGERIGEVTAYLAPWVFQRFGDAPGLMTPEVLARFGLPDELPA